MEVGSHLFNASVRSDGIVSVHGRGGSGALTRLVGGFVWARAGIRARSIGSTYSSGTGVVAGVDRELFKRLTQAQKALALSKTHIPRLLRTLGVTAPDAGQIERVLRSARVGKHRDFVAMCVKKLGGLLEVKRKLEAAVEELEAQMVQVAKPRIATRGTARAG